MNNTEYYIKNFYCGVHLQTKGITPTKIEQTPQDKRLFFYSNTEELQNHIQAFYADSDLQNFIKALIQFRGLMYSNTNTN